MDAFPDLNALSLHDLYATLISTGLARRLFQLMYDEDVGEGDLRGDFTSAICRRSLRDETVARLVTRQRCRISGLAVLPDLIDVFGGGIDVRLRADDGSEAEPGDCLAEFTGRWGQILLLERSLLNLISRLSGVATTTSEYVEAIRREAPGSKARLFDTRKTTPGMRVLEKYAVRCGGGMCHRLGLYDAMLIKDNHLVGVGVDQLAQFVDLMARRARSIGGRPRLRFVEVEVDTLEQLGALLGLEPGVVDVVLLDNMSQGELSEAVSMRDRAGSAVALEASGGVTLETVGAIARTGVERISVGALTHGARSVDLALDAE